MRERKNVNATNEMLDIYRKYLQDEERSRATVEKYLWDVKAFVEYLDGRENRATADDDGHMVDRGRALDKEVIRKYKNYLKDRYKITSANSMLAAINSFLVFLGKAE